MTAVINVGPQVELIVAQRNNAARVVEVVIADSNALFNGFGWDHGLQYGLVANGVQMFATGCVGPADSGSGIGYTGNLAGASGLTESVAGLNANLSTYVPTVNGMGTMQPFYRSSNNTPANPVGLQVNSGGALGASGALRGHWWFGAHAAGGGSWDVGFRRDESPYTTLATKTINTQTGAWGIGHDTLDLAADGTRAAWPMLQFTYRGGTQITAPVYLPFIAMERTDRLGGFSVTPAVFYAGKGLKDIASQWLANPANWRTEFLKALLLLAGPNGFLRVWVSSGVNDQNGTYAGVQSVGPSPADSGQPAGYADNFEAIRADIAAKAAAVGFRTGRVVFNPMPTHPQSTAGPSANIAAYTAEMARRYGASRDVTVIDPADPAIGTSAEWSARWDGGGSPHLSQAGYEQGGQRVVQAMFTAADAYRRRLKAKLALGAGVV